MRPLKDMGFATRQIHFGRPKENINSLITPIYQTATFLFDSAEQGGERFARREEGYIYTRLGNPSQASVEERLAQLEGGEAALCTASGMGAVTSAVWAALRAGDELVSSDTLYACSYVYLSKDLPKYGVHTKFVDMTDLKGFKESLTPKTRVVYLETPCNPTMKVIDIQAVAEIAHAYDPSILVMVDNTFCTPYIQRPLELGADVILHSATKYLNGHGDVIAGAIVGKADFLDQCRMDGLKNMTGAVISPFDAFLLGRGMKTLDIRMERHCANAQKVAEFFQGHPAVDKVYFPGLPTFEGYEIAKKQMSLPGGMVSIELKAGREAVAKALDRLELCFIAVSLGDAETLVEHAASMTHSPYTDQELRESGISPGLVRVSVGLEDPQDIIDDFKQALDTLL